VGGVNGRDETTGDLAGLLALAEAAESGSWDVVPEQAEEFYGEYHSLNANGGMFLPDEQVAFIAAFSPELAVALIRAVQAAQTVAPFLPPMHREALNRYLAPFAASEGEAS